MTAMLTAKDVVSLILGVPAAWAAAHIVYWLLFDKDNK